MRRVLVTGGAGFIGSHLIRSWLAAHPEDEVVNLDLLTYAGSRARLNGLEGSTRYRLIQGDINDRSIVTPAMQGVELIVHCAAETHVDRSITDAAPFIRTNAEGTQTLLDAAREAGVKRFLHLSTDEVYGPILDGVVDEHAPLRPRSPYAASKAAGDLLSQAAYHTYGLPVIIVRPTNIFGPGQFPEKFLPVCITHAVDRRPIPVYGDGQQRRGWLYIDDLCQALQLAASLGGPGDIYNVGSGHECTNLDLVTQVLSLMEQGRELMQFVDDRPGHDRRYAMNDDKLRALGWRPARPFEETLASTIAWYREHGDWWRPLAQALREDPYHWLNRPARPSAQPAPRPAR